MKLHYSLLEKLIELPTTNPKELRVILDEIGLEVKNVEGEGAATVFTIETLANRGDHTAALGAARELSARLLSTLKVPTLAVFPGIGSSAAGLERGGEATLRKASLPLQVSSQKCLRYALLELHLADDMRVPTEIRALLGEAKEDRHPIVDLINYVLLEFGQPMHAFDLDKLEGGLQVEELAHAEHVDALDGQSYDVPAGSIVIRDRKKIVAVAGVIGCANSMVTKATRKVVVESACFDPVSVRKTARAMRISTDASYAFERGSDRDCVLLGLRRLAHLCDGAGSSSTRGAHVVGLTSLENESAPRRVITLRFPRLRAQMNLPRLQTVEVIARLKHLGYAILSSMEPGKENALKEVQLQVPTWRVWDVHHEEDVIEDVVRSHGLQKVKLELPPLSADVPAPHPLARVRARIEPVLLGSGFREVITRGYYSGREIDLLKKVDPTIQERHVAILNAVDSNYSHMKVTNLLHLCRLAEHNHRHGIASFKVFELGRVFERSPGVHPGFEHEREVLSLAVSGRWYENEWRKAPAVEELLSLIKGTVQALFATQSSLVRFEIGANKLLHPGAQTELRVGKKVCGYFGRIHPLLRDGLDLRNDLVFAEIDIAALLAVEEDFVLRDPSDLPAIRRDITLKLPERERAQRVIDLIVASDPQSLRDTVIVDTFKRPDEPFRRVSYKLTFQRNDRTLASEEVDRAMQDILALLAEKHQITLA